MIRKKVYISGMGLVSSLGNDIDTVFSNLVNGHSGVQAMPEWKKYNGLNSHLMAPAQPYDSSKIPRKKRRSMSAMAEMGAVATFAALEQAGLGGEKPWDGIDKDRSIMIMGSTSGSPKTLEDHFKKLFEKGGPESQTSTAFFKIMNHSVPANVALAVDFSGPLLSTGSACSTSSQAMIQAWELIQGGLYDIAIVGGADEAYYTSAAIFDTVHAASTSFNDRPMDSPRPFDKDRDGLVISEGAGIVVMESEAHLKARGAKPLAEFMGGAYYCDGQHMSHPIKDSMKHAMTLALKRSEIDESKVDYVNAHATSTVLGDIQEAQAIGEMFPHRPPVSSLKGHFGHSLAACGTIEAICCIEMMNSGMIIPNRNLKSLDPECSSIDALKEVREERLKTVVSNNFAFGGMNASFVIRSCD